jgi:hypothetical protein
MKRVLSFVVLGICLMVFTPLNAQKVVGIKSGYLYSGYNTGYSSSDIHAGGKNGWYIGVTKEFRFGKVIGLQTEFLYQLLGYETGISKFNLNYLQIPVNLNINIGPFYLAAGAYGSMLVAGNEKIGETKLKHGWNSFTWGDWGFTFGTGLKFKRFAIDVRYQMGMQDFTVSAGWFNNEAIMVGGSIFF